MIKALFKPGSVSREVRIALWQSVILAIFLCCIVVALICVGVQVGRFDRNQARGFDALRSLAQDDISTTSRVELLLYQQNKERELAIRDRNRQATEMMALLNKIESLTKK